MKKILSTIIAVTFMLSIFALPVLAAVPANPLDPTLMMYVNDHTEGPVVPVNIDNFYAGQHGHVERLDPTNVYGRLDAVTLPNMDEYFFGIASRQWTNFTFGSGVTNDQNFGYNLPFYNIDDPVLYDDPVQYDDDGLAIVKEPHLADIKFREVTWFGINSWHPEGALVFLTGATIKTPTGTKAYTPTAQEGSLGYFAGMAANREAILGFTEEQKSAIRDKFAADYGVTGREFRSNTIRWDDPEDKVLATTYFHMPEEVVCATGITLVDATWFLYNYGTLDGQVENPEYPDGIPNISTYTGDAGKLLTFKERILDPTDLLMGDKVIADIVPGMGNTDGYDLDAIQVYRCIPWRTSDTATGLGTKILKKGTWFMYNDVNLPVNGTSQTFDIQAGNPKEGLTIIGTYTVARTSEGKFIVTYDINDTITKNGYVYDIVVVSEHLGISETNTFTANPGTDDNWDFGIEFPDLEDKPYLENDGVFTVFAHFSVEYK